MKIKSLFVYIVLIGFSLLRNGYAQEIPVTMATGHLEIIKFLESAGAGKNAKIIFEFNSNLHSLQIGPDSMFISKLSNTQNAVLPVISPDGKYYTFALGVSGDGEEEVRCSTFINSFDSLTLAKPIQVATQSYVPRFIQNAISPTVVYSTCSRNPDKSKHSWDGCGAVVKKSFDPIAKMFANEDTLWDAGSYFGGISYDNKYICTGWLGDGNALLLDRSLKTNKPICVHLTVKNDITLKDSVVPFQVCNPSISSSRIFTDAMMFFDVGSDRIPIGYTESVYKNWAQHEMFFISRINQKIQKGFKPNIAPEITMLQFDALVAKDAKGQSYGTEWNFPEWSNHPYLAVASVKIKRAWNDGKATPGFRFLDKNEYVSLINLKDSTFLPILKITDTIKSTGFQWPWLWAEIPSGFTEDTKWLDRTLGIKKYDNKNAIDHFQKTIFGGGKLLVFNSQGRLVFSDKTNVTYDNYQRYANNLSSGIYIVIVKDTRNNVILREVFNNQ